MKIGTNALIATTSRRGNGDSGEYMLFSSGARATIGIAASAATSGVIALPSSGSRAATAARRAPATPPTSTPTRALRLLCQAAEVMSPAESSVEDQMSLGAGRTKL